jgi:glycosyltransferase involved in cell wall biosynthesis
MLRSKSPGGIEPRLHRAAKALAVAGYEVHVILWDRTIEHPADEARDGYAIHRVWLKAPEGKATLLLKMLRWWREARRRAERLEPDVLHAVDLDTLWPALRARRRTGAKLVYDIFDFYAPMIARDIPTWVRGLVTQLERRAARQADLVILPDLARADFFRRRRPANLIEVMNVPEERPVEAHALPAFTVFYGGQIARDRGIPELVSACEATGARLIVAGHGPDEETLVPLVESSPVAEFKGNLPYAEVLGWTASCDVVAALYDPAIPNNRLASPNKLFEAMMLSKPVLTNDGIGLADFVTREGVGVAARYGDAESVRAALERLMLAPDACREMGARGRRLYEDRYRWPTQAGRLADAYEGLFRDATSDRRTSV